MWQSLGLSKKLGLLKTVLNFNIQKKPAFCEWAKRKKKHQKITSYIISKLGSWFQRKFVD